MWESRKVRKDPAAPNLRGDTSADDPWIFSLGGCWRSFRQVLEELGDKECREHYIAGKRPFCRIFWPPTWGAWRYRIRDI